MAFGLKRGVYETDYGNAAYVSGPDAVRAFDLDMRIKDGFAELGVKVTFK